MFNIGASELILILLIAFIVVGPKDLPKVARALGRKVRGARRMIEEVKREAGFDELERDFKSVTREVEDSVRAPDIRPELRQTREQLDRETGSVTKEMTDMKKTVKDSIKDK